MKQYNQWMLVLLLALFGRSDLMGQNYVAGNRYRDANPIIRIDKRGTSDKGDPAKMFDGIDEQGSYWKAAQKGPVSMVLSFKEEQTFSGLSVFRSGNYLERAVQIDIYKSETGKDPWVLAHSEKNIDRGETSGDRSLSFDFDGGNITTQYVKLVFTPAEGQLMAINEIRFTGLSSSSSSVLELLQAPTILHKHPKWIDQRGGLTNKSTGDRFGEDEPMFNVHENPLIVDYPVDYIQSAHTYIDTIYMHEGQSVRLSLPNRQVQDNNTNSSVKSYQRWYSFRTDGTYRTNNTGADEVWDLLTPVNNADVYRFANGYVGNPASNNVAEVMNFYYPTKEEFQKWFPNYADDPNRNLWDWFVVACDVSSYNDFTETFSSSSHNSSLMETGYEPTLSRRVLYYIVNVDGRNSSTGSDVNFQNSYGQITRCMGDRYLEEYEITFPTIRLNGKPRKTSDGNTHCTPDLVALSKDAMSYVIPDEANDTDELTVTIEEGTNTAGIKLLESHADWDAHEGTYNYYYPEAANNTLTISGETRIIHFDYPNTNEDGTQSVNDVENPSATILVRKTVNGTTYNIARYKLTFTQNTQLLTQTQVSGIEKNETASLHFRTPAYLKKNYTPLTSLTWNYDLPSGTYGQSRQNYYYPFPMGWNVSSYAFYDGSTKTDYASATEPQWGYYAIMNNFVEQVSHWSGAPTVTNPLLPDSKYHLYVDASDRPGVIARLPFRVDLCQGTELMVSAWVKSSGYSEMTVDAGMLFTIMGVKEVSGREIRTPIYRYATGQIRRTDYLKNQIPGCGANTNEWLQVYFSFVVPHGLDANYDSFVLQVDNNSASTSGGDMYLDEIHLYIATPEARVQQKTPTCDEETLLQLQTNFEPLLSRTASQGEGSHYVNFCFVDSLKYVEALNSDHSNVQAAIEASVVPFSYPIETGRTKDFEYGRLSFDATFDNNKEYNDEEGAINFQEAGVGGEGALSSHFFRMEDSENLAVDIYAQLVPFRRYLFAMVVTDDSGTPSVSAFTEDLLAPCAIVSSFNVTSQSVIKVNGNVLTSDADFCQGQVVDFSVQLEGNIGQGDQIIEERVYYDWLFVSYDDFVKDESGVSLKTALAAFRNAYPTANTLQPAIETGFTQAEYDLLNEYEAKITFYQPNLNVRLDKEGEFNMMICPCPVRYTEPELVICTEPVPITLRVVGEAPEAKVGFHDVIYDDEEPAVRIGLKQVNDLYKGSQLTIPLRGVKLVSLDGVQENGTLETRGEQIYLISSDDPEVLKVAGQMENGLGSSDWPIGRILGFSASTEGAGANQLVMKFDGSLVDEEGIGELISDDFRPREGFRYTLLVPFQQEVSGTAATNLCYGTLLFDLYVVPEYQRWIGGSDSNWNNDANWVRSYADELQALLYTDYKDGHRGFVPMDFTKVTIPRPDAEKEEGGQAKLYGDQNKPTDHSPLSLATVDVSQAATQGIEYDLLVKKANDGSNYECEPYYTNTVEQIYFEANTEMLHAEKLAYDTARVEYELTKGQWHLLASPLQGVVAGDFYTDRSGEEESEYFQPIFYDTRISGNNSRYEPSVYQRGWKGNATLTTVGGLESEEGETRDVAVSGNWSGVYNEVKESYTPGTGFSLRVQDIDKDKVLFRLPKADEKYSYYGGGGYPVVDMNGNIIAEEVSREKAGQLFEKGEMTVTLNQQPDNTSYYLVGNPFMAHLNMKKFLDRNNSVLDSKYWYVGDDGTQKSDNSLIPPLHSFFVKKSSTDATNVTITFTHEMQALGNSSTSESEDEAGTQALMITATNSEGKMSRALVAADSGASDEYRSAEDAELFLDSNLGDVPMVYTVAGTMATSINVRPTCERVPLAVYSSRDEEVTLLFEGVESFTGARLYDAKEKRYTPLTNGLEARIRTNDFGRYFLTDGLATENETIHADGCIQIYALRPGELVVASPDTPLRSIRVFGVNGALLLERAVKGRTTERLSVPRGQIYVIYAEDEQGIIQNKKLYLD